MQKKTKKKYKMISIEYTYDCLKKPPCSFCYLRRERTFHQLRSSPALFDFGYLKEQFRTKIQEAEQIAIGFNGIWISDFLGLVSACREINPGVVINLTTCPDFITPGFSALLKKNRIGLVALSLDFEKCDWKLENWLAASRLLKEKLIRVGANILMTDPMFSQISKVIKTVEPYCQQIHLLRPKFYRTKIQKEKRKRLIFLLKQQYLGKLHVDQCFRFELLGIPCTRGKDFLAIHPNGSITPCTFELSSDSAKKLTKCPFI